jgi:butyrate kinase
VLALNPGSTSTKVALYQGARVAFETTVRHSDDDLEPFRDRPVLDQLVWRLEAVRAALTAGGVDLDALDAVVGRGGLLRPLEGGVYRVGEAMLAELREAPRGEHASNLGAFLAAGIAAQVPGDRPAFVVDPVSVDEWEDVARLSGLQGVDRECLSHALNTRAVARRYADETGSPYATLRLVVAHLGSGISVSAHRDGRMVDVTNSMQEGAYSTERAGTVPSLALVLRAIREGWSEEDAVRHLFREGGMFSYLGTRDLREALRRAEAGDARADLVVRAMLHQIRKDVGAMASVLEGRVDAVLLTGGMVKAGRITDGLRDTLRWIGPVVTYPGENELRALAEGAIRALLGSEPAREYAPAAQPPDASPGRRV